MVSPVDTGRKLKYVQFTSCVYGVSLLIAIFDTGILDVVPLLVINILISYFLLLTRRISCRDILAKKVV